MIHSQPSARAAPKRTIRRAAKRPLQLLFLSATSLWAVSAYGQTIPATGAAATPLAITAAVPAEAGTPGVQDVIVTATRQSTRLQKTPVAVTVVGVDAITTQNLITARDLAGQTPGVTIERSGITPLTQTFFIRGIGDGDPIFDPNVAQYVDDVYLPRAINGMSDLSDVERVEAVQLGLSPAPPKRLGSISPSG